MNKKPKPTSETDATLRELSDGASKVFQNAEELYHEASALHAAGALSRALFLHQISLEECAKIEMLGAWAASVLTGMKADAQRLALAWANHKAKNYTNAYLLPVTEAEANARRNKRWDEALKAFKRQQTEFHQESNSAKNASLYVDLQNGTFTAPRERVTAPMVAEIAEANAKHLSAAYPKVEMLKRWVDKPDKVREMLTWFESRLKELMSQSDDPGQALSVILDEMLSRAKTTGYAQAMTTDEKESES